jgi:hypothetical protein
LALCQILIRYKLGDAMKTLSDNANVTSADNQVPEVIESDDRRNALKAIAKFAAYTAPVLLVMTTTSKVAMASGATPPVTNNIQ